MRILVIGGTGFIGSPLVRRLAAGGHAVTVAHRGHTAAPAGVRSWIIEERAALSAHAGELRAIRPDVVVDCILSDGPQAEELMSLLRGVVPRAVALSSQDVYRAAGVLHGTEEGPPDPVPLTEESPLRTKLHPYPPAVIAQLRSRMPWLTPEYDKIPVERAVMSDPEVLGTVLRLPMVYGPGDVLHRFHPLIKRMDDQRPVILFDERTAAWRGTRGFVDDVAAAIALAAVSPQASGRIYNIGEPDALTEAEWAAEIADAAGWSGRIVTLPAERTPAHLRMPYNIEQHWITDTSRIRRELGFRQTGSRRTALERTIEYERANPPAVIDPKLFDYAAEDAVVA